MAVNGDNVTNSFKIVSLSGASFEFGSDRQYGRHAVAVARLCSRHRSVSPEARTRFHPDACRYRTRFFRSRRLCPDPRSYRRACRGKL